MKVSPPPIPFDQPCLVALQFLSSTLVGGESVMKQLRLLAADIRIATPGRLNNFIPYG
jgi:superfamily II DNA/RNA helicase